MKRKTKLTILIPILLALSACGESGPAGPDLSGINDRDHTYFNQVFSRCSINNTALDCNCVARVNVEHRAAAYELYAAEYDTKHKPELIAEIDTKTATLVEKTRNRSDERVLEALELELHDLEAKLEAGVDNIDDFELPFLPAGATDACVING